MSDRCVTSTSGETERILRRCVFRMTTTTTTTDEARATL